jgi:hypothetical protein
MNEQFRNDYLIANFIRFGKLPKELNVKLANETTDLHFSWLRSKPSDRIAITASKGFRFAKQVEFKQFHKIIKEMDVIAELSPSHYLSSYRQVRDDIFISENYYPMLIQKIYDYIPYLTGHSKDPRDRFEFDFCNPNNIEKFYEAEEYHLKERSQEGGLITFAKIVEKDDIFKTVINRALATMEKIDLFNLRIYLQGVRVSCVKGGKSRATSLFLLHISTEFLIKGEAVFYIDGKWYQLKESFLNELRRDAQHIFKQYKATASILKFGWNKAVTRTEKEYNLLYESNSGYIVLDTTIVDGVELCDILHYTDDGIYLVHVKYGFGSQIRELTNQVLISARRLREALGVGKRDLLEKVYEKLTNSGRDLNGLRLNEFKDLFDKNITMWLE